MRYAGAELSAAGVLCESFRRGSLNYSAFLFADGASSESFRRGSFELFRLSLMGPGSLASLYADVVFVSPDRQHCVCDPGNCSSLAFRPGGVTGSEGMGRVGGRKSERSHFIAHSLSDWATRGG